MKMEWSRSTWQQSQKYQKKIPTQKKDFELKLRVETSQATGALPNVNLW